MEGSFCDNIQLLQSRKCHHQPDTENNLNYCMIDLRYELRFELRYELRYELRFELRFELRYEPRY